VIMPKKQSPAQEMEPFVERFVEAASELGGSFGLNRTVCRIYALLYLAPAPLSPSEIGRLLSMSKGNVSINLRILEEWDAVGKVWEKGAARPRYAADGKIEDVIFGKLKKGLAKRADALASAMEEISSRMQRAEPGTHKHAKQRLARVSRLLKTLEFLIENLDSLKSLAQ